MTKEEAIKTLRELWRETNDPWYEEVYNMAIEALSAERTGEWIPCSKRLPERNRSVLVYESIHENIYAAYYDSAYGWMTFDPCWNGCFPEYLNIIAWMPLPSPWAEMCPC